MAHKNIITPEARASYAHVWEKSEMPNGTMMFSVSLMFPKTDKKGIADLQAAITSAAVAFFGEDKKKWPASLASPLHDGDKSDKGEAYEGHMYMNPKTQNQPGIVGPDARPLMDQDLFYSGVYCRASVNFQGYNKGGNKGIGVYLNNLMRIRDGDRLDGRKSAENEFGSFASEDETTEAFLD